MNMPLQVIVVVGTKSSCRVQFLKQGENGYYHEPSNVESLKEALKKNNACPISNFNRMGKKSHECPKSMTPDTWAAVVWKIFN